MLTARVSLETTSPFLQRKGPTTTTMSMTSTKEEAKVANDECNNRRNLFFSGLRRHNFKKAKRRFLHGEDEQRKSQSVSHRANVTSEEFFDDVDFLYVDEFM